LNSPDLDQYREYADWYVWSKRNLSIESSVCHGAAAAASAVIASGGTREQAIAAARRSVTSGAHAQSDHPDLRRRTYAEWFDWARRELGGVREQQHAAAAAALRTLDLGQGANLAMINARAAAGVGPPDPQPPAQAPPPPPAPPGFPPATYAPMPMPPPPPPPQYFPPGYGYAPVAVRPSPYAGFWRRTAAFLLDTLIGVAAWAALVFAVTFVVVGVLLAGGRTADNFNQAVPGWLGFAYYGVGFVMTWLYYTFMEASGWQGTIGKHALGIKVTGESGARISWLRANARYWSKAISFLMLGIGFLMVAITDRKQALHDMVAGTLVVSRRPPS